MMEIGFLLIISLTGPEGQPIELNAAQIVTVRPPRHAEHFGPGVKCIIHTTDGKYVAVIETCDAVLKLLGDTKP